MSRPVTMVPGRPPLGRACALTLAAALAIGLAGCAQGVAGTPSSPVPSQAASPPAASPLAGTCTPPQQQPDMGKEHMNDLGRVYAAHPATSGPHYPVPLPPQPAVYTSEVPESRAVHNLEHGYVVVYYQPAGDDALAAPVLGTLRSAIPTEPRTLLAPYPALPARVSLALTAWRVLQQCPRQVTSDEARAVVSAFVARYRDSPAAPEPGAR